MNKSFDALVLRNFVNRWQDVKPDVKSRISRRMNHRTSGGISVVPVDGVDLVHLVKIMKDQLCNRWEIVLQPGTQFPQNRQIRVAPFKHQTSPVDAALAAVRYSLVLFVTTDLFLEKDAVYHLLRMTPTVRAALFFWDYLQIDFRTQKLEPICQPTFSLDQYLSNPTHGGVFAVKTVAAQAIGWGLGEADFTVRLIEGGGPIAHIPKFLHTISDRPIESHENV
jgi:hypothetical protein